MKLKKDKKDNPNIAIGRTNVDGYGADNSGIGIGTANTYEANNLGIGITNVDIANKPGIGTVVVNGVNKSATSTANTSEPSKSAKGTADIDEANNSNTSIADANKGVDQINIGIIDTDRANNLGIKIKRATGSDK